LLKIKPKYFQTSLGYKIGLSRVEMLRGGGLKDPCDLEK